MKCPKCGRVYADTVAFCPVDDAVLVVTESSLRANEPDALRPGAFASTDASAGNDSPIDEEITAPPEAPRWVEPIPSDEDEQITQVSERSAAPLPPPRTRMEVPMTPPPPPVNYVPARPHPAAPNSNPWKVAFLAMLGVLAIGAILFYLLRNNPNAQNSNTPPLVADPNSSPLLTASPPNGQGEISAPTVASPPPYSGDSNVNASTTPTPTSSPVNSNVDLPPITPTPTATPTPKNQNQNSANSNSSPTPTPATRPSPVGTPKPPTPTTTATPPG